MECDRRVFLINSTTALTLLGLGFFLVVDWLLEVQYPGSRVGLRMGKA